MIVLDINWYKTRVSTTIEKDSIESSRWRENRREQENALFAPQVKSEGCSTMAKSLVGLTMEEDLRKRVRGRSENPLTI
jgi:hypothetical protein